LKITALEFLLIKWIIYSRTFTRLTQLCHENMVELACDWQLQKGIIESHGGTIWLSKGYTKGPSFKLTLSRNGETV
jgi:signal transduction histidine kinase